LDLAEQAVRLHREGRESEAEPLYLRILAGAPSDFTANYMLGVIRFKQARAAEALALFERAIAANPAATGPMIFRGLLLQQGRRLEDALAAFERVLAIHDKHIEAWVNRGNVLCDLGRFPEALASYDRALQINPHFEAALYNRGNALRALGRFPDALASFDAALAANPNYADAWVNRGSTLRDLHRLEEALASFDRALTVMPASMSALYNRGTVLNDLNRLPEALEALNRALSVKPDFAEALNNRAVVLQKMKHLAAALADYESVLAFEPDNADAWSNRGNLLRDMKRTEEALISIDRALGIHPSHGDALNNRGNVLKDLKRFEEALACFDHALAIDPENVLLRCNRAMVLEDLKRFDEALAGYERALALAPDNARTLYNRGLTLLHLHRPREALPDFDRALALQPRLAEAHAARGDALRDLGKLEEALSSYDWSLTLAPDEAGVLNNRGAALQDLRRFAQALESYDRALEIEPDFVNALYNRGNLLWLNLQRFAEARRDLERVARLAPNHDYIQGDLLHLKMQEADWRDIEQDFAAIEKGVEEGRPVVRPFIYQPISESPAALQRASILYAAHRFPPASKTGNKPRRADGKIRVGYVSGDFREQATAFLTAGLYECHDRGRFEIVGFDRGWDDGSALRRRLEKSFDKFVILSHLPNDEAAEKIKSEEIDILVNLNGYFGAESMGIFARRPAPIQVNYLGFPATLGAPYIDYILADRIVIPEEEQDFYTEKVAYLPDTYQVNDFKRPIAPAVPSRATHGLPDQAFVFCNFNHIYKLTPAMFAMWMDILKETENSVLWLLRSNKGFPSRLKAEAERLGVAGERLVFAAPAAPADHLARMSLADLFLDSLPYNAHTTASDSLWAGLPLLTCRGKTFPGRVATSLLHAAGLPELVTENLTDYRTMALTLASDPALLAKIRDRLRHKRLSMPLFDTGRFCRHIEAAYRSMWEMSQRGEAPRGFSVAPVP
jgi:predicted O-linked N-acetylglucosamine transferase (SPINDLY family)